MQIEILVGSHRKKSESGRIGCHIADLLSSRDIDAGIISLAGNPLPLWDEGVWSGAPEWKEHWKPISNRLNKADGFVVVTPEWGGMVPPGLKNLLLLASPQEVGHKPALIVSISAGEGGAYPVTELRSVGYKNNRMLFIPEHVIIRRVGDVFAAKNDVATVDDAVAERLNYSLKILTAYTEAMNGVRKAGILDYKKFPFGQ